MAPGYQLMLPLKGASLEPLPTMFQPPPAREVRMGVRKLSYTVKHGDTLATIAQRYKVGIDELRTWNQVGRLVVGQRLVIQVEQAIPAKSTRPSKSARPIKTTKTAKTARSAKKTK